MKYFVMRYSWCVLLSVLLASVGFTVFDTWEFWFWTLLMIVAVEFAIYAERRKNEPK